MRHSTYLISVILPVVVGSLGVAGCGGGPGETRTEATLSQTSRSLVNRRTIDLDALHNDPATLSYTDAASNPNSPCAPLLQDVIALGEVLAPAVATKNYGAIATHLPQILATFKELFACVKSERASSTSTSALPLPEAPEVPFFDSLKPCVTVIFHGKSADTCPF